MMDENFELLMTMKEHRGNAVKLTRKILELQAEVEKLNRTISAIIHFTIQLRGEYSGKFMGEQIKGVIDEIASGYDQEGRNCVDG